MPADTDGEVEDPPTAGQEGVGWTTNELEELQQKDPNIGPLFAWFRSGNRPSREEVSNADSELKCYWTQWDSLELIDGLVYRKFERPDGSNKSSQLLIPRATRHRFLEMVHSRETGHVAWPKTMEQVQRRAFWAAWRTDVKLYCACWKECNEFHRGRPPKQAGLKPMSVGAPMKVLHVDLTGPHVNCQGYRYIMTAYDAFTRFVIAVPLRNTTALSVARALVHEVVLKYGMPQSILTDLGGEFQNELWKELCQ